MSNTQNHNHNQIQLLLALMVFAGVIVSAFALYSATADTSDSRSVDRLPVRAAVEEEATSDTGLEPITIIEPVEPAVTKEDSGTDPEPPPPGVDPDPSGGTAPTAPQEPATEPEPDPDPVTPQPTAPTGPALELDPDPEPDPDPVTPQPSAPTGPALELEPDSDGDSGPDPQEPPAVGDAGSLVQLGTDDPQATDGDDPGVGGVMAKPKLPADLINITDQDLKDYCRSIGGEVQYGTFFVNIEGFEQDLNTADCVKDGKVIVHCVEAHEGLMWNCVKGIPAPDDLWPTDPQRGALEEPTKPAGPTSAGSAAAQSAMPAA